MDFAVQEFGTDAFHYAYLDAETELERLGIADVEVRVVDYVVTDFDGFNDYLCEELDCDVLAYAGHDATVRS